MVSLDKKIAHIMQIGDTKSVHRLMKVLGEQMAISEEPYSVHCTYYTRYSLFAAQCTKA